MTDEIQKIVTALPGLSDVTGVWDVAERRLAQGDAAFLTDLGIALAKRYDSAADRMWQYRSVFDRLLRLLTTTPGPENVGQALRLISTTGSRAQKRDRYAASLLASSHTAEDLAAAFAGGGSSGGASEELRACLVHEMVLRGVAVAETPGIAKWATSPHWSHHPLGWLPLSLSDVEGHLDLPSYTLGGGGHSIPYGPSENRGVTPDLGTPVPTAVEATTETQATAMAKAVANWADESNGRIEAKGFDLAQPLDAGAVPSTLVALGLECLTGVGRRSKFSISACPPAQVWRVLFAAASTGGAYNSGCYGAYGRLAAWQSLAGLSGAPEGAPADEVEARARECAWYSFSAATKWFEQVAWDIGLVAVAPERRRLTVLAATDTD